MATEAVGPAKRRVNLGAITGFFATFAAAAGFLFTYRRRLDILYAVVIHESIAYAPIILGIVILLAGMIALWRSPLFGPHLRIAAASSGRWVSAALLLLVIVSAATLFAVERWRYRVYSEVEYQQIVMRALNKANVVAARTLCESYLARYPQRRERSAIPDPVCTQVLSLSRDLGRLRHYISNQPPRREVVQIRGIGVPFGWGTRARATELLKQLSGDPPPSNP